MRLDQLGANLIIEVPVILAICADSPAVNTVHLQKWNRPFLRYRSNLSIPLHLRHFTATLRGSNWPLKHFGWDWLASTTRISRTS